MKIGLVCSMFSGLASLKQVSKCRVEQQIGDLGRLSLEIVSLPAEKIEVQRFDV
jgi:hypothetical protein